MHRDALGPDGQPHRLTGTPRPPGLRLAVAAVLAPLVLAACGSSATAGDAPTLRLGYLANLTHAPAVVGLRRGFLATSLGSTHVRPQVFNAGPQETEALLGGSLDAAFLGPTPAVNAFVRSQGDALRIVSGVTSGGAGLVVRAGSGISTAADLRGRRLATPQLGNTQDVALRAWLLDHGLHTDTSGGGDVLIGPAENATIVTLFRAGRIDGAWVPEPYLSRLIVEGQGTLLVDEASLWPQGAFPTAVLAVSRRFEQAHPEIVRTLVAGLRTTIDWISANDTEARTVTGAGLADLSGKALPEAVLRQGWSRLRFTNDPLLAELKTGSDNAFRVGVTKSVADLHGIWDGRFLNGLLQVAGRPPVPDSALGASGP